MADSSNDGSGSRQLKSIAVGAGLGVGLIAVVVVAGRLRKGTRSRGASAGTKPRSAALRTSRAHRTADLARMGTTTGARFVQMKAKSAVSSRQRREQLRSEFEFQTAEQIAESLGNMRGAMMKLGQMASYLDQGLPEPVREALAQLQSDAPPMAPHLVTAVVSEELGAEPGELFAVFDEAPIAAASIGQVHRAVTHDGREVAVKVQYPGVGDAVAADLENSELLFQLMGMLFPGLDAKPLVAEIRDRVVEELDYRLEASNQQIFADAYREHPFIHVPDVIPELSTKRVLTTEFAYGSRFAEVLQWSDEERQLTAECLYRFAFGSIYQLHIFNGDPHPGNYVFQPGGHVTFLDFGLCKHFTDDEIKVFEDMIIAMVIDSDIAQFRRIVERIGILPEGFAVSDSDLRDYFGHFYEFVMDDEVMEITPEWSSQSVRQFFDLGGPHADIMKAANLPPSMVIAQRINLGLFALFGDLGARGNWRRLAEELWPFTNRAPSTPMGEQIAVWESERSGAKSADAVP